jgi:hypothetical protein
VALQHELCNTGMGVPKLHPTILGATEHPVAVRCKSYTKHKVLGDFSPFLVPFPRVEV